MGFTHPSDDAIHPPSRNLLKGEFDAVGAEKGNLRPIICCIRLLPCPLLDKCLSRTDPLLRSENFREKGNFPNPGDVRSH